MEETLTWKNHFDFVWPLAHSQFDFSMNNNSNLFVLQFCGSGAVKSLLKFKGQQDIYKQFIYYRSQKNSYRTFMLIFEGNNWQDLWDRVYFVAKNFEAKIFEVNTFEAKTFEAKNFEAKNFEGKTFDAWPLRPRSLMPWPLRLNQDLTRMYLQLPLRQ